MKKIVCILIIVFCASSLFAFDYSNTMSEEESSFFVYKEPSGNNIFQGLRMEYSNSKVAPFPLSFFHEDNYIFECFDYESGNRTFEVRIYDVNYTFTFNKNQNDLCCTYNGNFYYEPHAVASLISSMEVLLTTEVYIDYGTTSDVRRCAYEKVINQFLFDIKNRTN